MSRPLSSLPFSSTQKEWLQNGRFSTTGDILGLSLSELAKELHISRNDALNIRKVVQKTDIEGEEAEKVSQRVSGLDRLKTEMSRHPILTFCNDMDVILGGGVQIGQTTEFCGWPGIGKTQLCKQLAVDVQIPHCLGGADGSAIYIDTEGSFMVERVVQMCEEFISHLQRMTATRDEEQRSAVSKLTLESLLSNIHYYRVTDYVEQVALIHILPKILEKHANVKLVVVDSIAFHFRHSFTDMVLRTRLMSQMAQQLQSAAETHEVAVVVTNQVTTRIVGEQSSFLQPALGDTWSHAVTNRVLLFWEDGQRFAHLQKSPVMAPDAARFQVTTMGVRGVARTSKRVRESDDEQRATSVERRGTVSKPQI